MEVRRDGEGVVDAALDQGRHGHHHQPGMRLARPEGGQKRVDLRALEGVRQRAVVQKHVVALAVLERCERPAQRVALGLQRSIVGDVRMVRQPQHGVQLEGGHVGRAHVGDGARGMLQDQLVQRALAPRHVEVAQLSERGRFARRVVQDQGAAELHLGRPADVGLVEHQVDVLQAEPLDQARDAVDAADL
jgi:hypothetical protein